MTRLVSYVHILNVFPIYPWNFMDLQGQWDLSILRELEKDGGASQRTLANKLGVALGLTNLYLKRLAQKGYIKITALSRNRTRYLLTQQGLTEQSRLTHLYMQHQLSYSRDVRGQVRGMLSPLAGNGRRVAICGTNDLAEPAYLSLLEMNINCVGFMGGDRRKSFLSCPVSSPELAANWEFDRVLIADLERASDYEELLVKAGVPKEKVMKISLGRCMASLVPTPNSSAEPSRTTLSPTAPAD